VYTGANWAGCENKGVGAAGSAQMVKESQSAAAGLKTNLQVAKD